jgi:hypothetical protein
LRADYFGLPLSSKHPVYDAVQNVLGATFRPFFFQFVQKLAKELLDILLNMSVEIWKLVVNSLNKRGRFDSQSAAAIQLADQLLK